MDIVDQAGFPLRLYRGVIDEERLFASLVVKTLWTVRDGRIALDETQDWVALDSPKPTPDGVLPSDQCFYKGGADVMLLGQARAAEPVARLAVSVSIGSGFSASVLAIGRREWRKRLLRGLEISPPQPFTSMPLTLQGAFGGSDAWDGLAVPFPDNPGGTGYYLSAASAEGRPLPTVEDPAHLIERWDDHPSPVGLGLRPTPFGPHLRQAVEFDAAGELSKLHPLFFNNAFPACIAPAAAAGDQVRVSGVLPGSEWGFVLPACPARAQVRIGERVHALAMRLDQLWLEPESGRVRIAWRSPFRYHLRSLERRVVSLERAA
jgi:hypothetical protein